MQQPFYSQSITNKNNICNNCGKQGHLFHQCKLPITSCGIILFRKRTKEESKSSLDSKSEYEYLMIRRKDSFGYIGFLRGKYIQHNAEQLQNMFDEMSIGEKENIRLRSFDTLWKQMWGETYIGSQYKSEELISQKKFDILKNGINITENNLELISNYKNEVNQFRAKKIDSLDLDANLILEPILVEPNSVKSQFISLETLIDNSSTKWKETEWEFPKGRRNYQEKDLDCAIREFEEETGISKHNINVIENIMPFEEIFVGSNHKAYKHKYFLAFMNDEEDEKEKEKETEKETEKEPRFTNSKYSLSNFQKTEVSKIKWKNLSSCLESIRPYNLEKKHLILNINNILKEYTIF
jgi:ADP-ribose pyrophosphatase YjhB (NUDIX family)